MFEAIIFLTGVVERTALRAALLGHNAALNVLTIESALDLAALRYFQE